MTSLERGLQQTFQALLRAAWSEVSSIRPRIHGLQSLAGLIPATSEGIAYVRLLRLMGCSIGAGTVLKGMPMITGVQSTRATNLRIGENCRIGVGCEFEIADKITIGSDVVIGHQALLLTTTHELGSKSARSGALVRCPIIVEDNVALGARCVILPGVRVGAGSIVDPCSVVTATVVANTRVSGTPARQVENLKP